MKHGESKAQVNEDNKKKSIPYLPQTIQNEEILYKSIDSQKCPSDK